MKAAVHQLYLVGVFFIQVKFLEFKRLAQLLQLLLCAVLRRKRRTGLTPGQYRDAFPARLYNTV